MESPARSPVRPVGQRQTVACIVQLPDRKCNQFPVWGSPEYALLRGGLCPEKRETARLQQSYNREFLLMRCVKKESVRRKSVKMFLKQLRFKNQT